jgi:hypothetical protein
MKALFGFTAQFCLHRLLQRLEQGSNAWSADRDAWLWTAGLGLNLLLEVFVDNWLKFVTEMRLQMPIIALISTLVFQKATRRPITYDIQSKVPWTNTNGSTATRKQSKQPPANNSGQRSRQSEINLINVDRYTCVAPRIPSCADIEQFASLTVLWPQSPLPPGFVQNLVKCGVPDAFDRPEKHSFRICSIDFARSSLHKTLEKVRTNAVRIIEIS